MRGISAALLTFVLVLATSSTVVESGRTGTAPNFLFLLADECASPLAPPRAAVA